MESKDEMDSLFEGMVLFNPFQIAAQEHTRDDFDHNQQTPPPPDPAPPTIDEALPSSSSASQPLDENLFSDLTLIVPIETLVDTQPQSDPSSTSPAYINTVATTTPSPSPSPSPSVSSTTTTSGEVLPPRQISSRKKKRAGLRIGYGRDAQISDDQSHSLESELPQPSPVQSSSSSVAESGLDGAQEEEGEEGGGEEEEEGKQEEEASSCTHYSTSIGIDSSHTRTGNDISCPVDNSVSDAEPVALSNGIREEDNKQVNSSSPIELRFEQIRGQISEKLKHAREVVGSVSAIRKDTVRRRRKAAENLNLASANYREMEKELEEACEAEDFETADRVSESLASAEREKELLSIALRDAEAECDAVDLKLQEVLQCQIAAEDECASLLESFAVDAANNADLVLKNAEVISSKEMGKWLSSTEALEIKKMELEIESHLVNDAQVIFNDSIEHSVKDDRIERELLCKRKEMLTEELVKLLALVKQKEAEIAENDSKIENVEKKIADTVSSFQEAQSSINTKYNNLQSGLSEMELHNEALSRKKEDIDDFLSQEEGRGAKIKELARISADEADVYREAVGLRKSLVQFISKSREDKVRLGRTAEKFSEDVQMLKQEISAARASLQELSSTKSSFQQEIESFKQRLLFIDKRVPELEAEKKVAATARNFKEAARIATEAKTLYVEKDGIKLKMEGVMSELGKLEEEISDIVKRLQEIEEQLSSKEKDLAMARFQRLLLIAGAATAERLAALELGDLEEADILLAEAEAANSEARKFEPIYNFKGEEFENLPKHYISMELVSNLGGKQLAELAASGCISTS